MAGNKNTILDALTAEMLGDVQKLHQELAACSSTMADMGEKQAAMEAAAESMKNTLVDTEKQFEIMARGILIFAMDEQAKTQASQKTSLKELTDSFASQLKKNTASFKMQLWLIFAVNGVIFLTLLALFLVLKT